MLPLFACTFALRLPVENSLHTNKIKREGGGKKELKMALRLAICNTALPHEKDGSREKTDAEWAQILTPKQFACMRRGMTDAAWGPLVTAMDGSRKQQQSKSDGMPPDAAFCCAACRSILYTAAMRLFPSCGWCSFFDCMPKADREVFPGTVMTAEEAAKLPKLEIVCNRCSGHLGHVFRRRLLMSADDKKQASPDRHCVNSSAILFVTQEGVVIEPTKDPRQEEAEKEQFA